MRFPARIARHGGLLIAALSFASPAGAAILETRVVSGREWRLADMGTLDWVVFAASEQGPAAPRGKPGAGLIERQLRITGDVTVAPGRFGDGEFDWPPGPNGDDGTGNQSEAPPALTLSLAVGASVAVQFSGAPAGGQRLGAVWLRHKGRAIATVAQGPVRRTVPIDGAGWVRVLYDGAEPVTVALAGVDPSPRTVTSLAAVLSTPAVWWVRDGKFVFAYAPTPQDELLRRSRARPAPDFLRLARDYADVMLRHGRDHYGAVSSPLFSRSLTREAEPVLLPYPLYAELSAEKQQGQAWSEQSRRPPGLAGNPYHRFNYNRVLNHPKGLGPEGPHKITVYGADLLEDRDLFAALYALSANTGEAKYVDAARDALTWWYAHTQRTGGLYPWGEHAGWDLVNECPTYFAGPSQWFFEANYHEVRDFLLYPEFLAALPAAPPGGLSPLDNYALGVWRHHFWDKEKAYFNRHADIDGIVSQQGEWMGFPAHLGYYLRLWSAALAATHQPAAREELTLALTRVTDMALSRTEKYGFFPFSFEPELLGKEPGRETPAQSLRLAHHAFEVSGQLETIGPEVAARLRRFSRLQLKEQADDVTRRNLRLARETGDVSFLAGKTMPPPDQVTTLRDFSDDALSENLAQEILNCVWFHRDTGRPEYLAAAEAYARIASEAFCDDRSPLPRAFRFEAPRRTATGAPFPDFYFGGARLMRAFAELGAVQTAAARTKR